MRAIFKSVHHTLPKGSVRKFNKNICKSHSLGVDKLWPQPFLVRPMN